MLYVYCASPTPNYGESIRLSAGHMQVTFLLVVDWDGRLSVGVMKKERTGYWWQLHTRPKVAPSRFCPIVD